MTAHQRSMAAVKANRTRRARRDFYENYPYTAEMAQDLLSGYSTSDVAEMFNVPRSTVAAVQANLTRPGTFSDMAHACNYRR